MASFGLEDDAALARLGTIVHALDVGGEPVPEAVGFEAVMAGARERITDDDALLAEMSNVLDSLYAHFQRQAPGAGRQGHGAMNRARRRRRRRSRPRTRSGSWCATCSALGTWGFGGPVALVGYMYRDLVEKRRWISESDYKEGLALAQLMPGPLAAQLAIYLGYVHYRIRGATLVGIAFVLPSFLMVVALGAAYTRYGGIGWMQAVFYGVGAAVIGIIAMSAYKLTTKNIGKDKLLWAIFLVSAAVTVITAVGDRLDLPRRRRPRLAGPRAAEVRRAARMHSLRRTARSPGSRSTPSTGTSSARSAPTSPTPAASSSAAAWRSCPSSTAASSRSTTG